MMPMTVGRAVLCSKILRREQFAADHEILNARGISCQLTQYCIQQLGTFFLGGLTRKSFNAASITCSIA